MLFRSDNYSFSRPTVQTYQIIHQTMHPALTDKNRARLKLGVGEEVVLSGMPTNTIWNASAGTLSGSNGNGTMFTAPNNKGTVTVTAKVNGISLQTIFNVVEPASESAVIYSNNTYSAGSQGVGMRLAPITVAPTSVSFYNVECLEVPGPATEITGYFTNYPAITLAHNPNTNWIQLTENNTWADNAAFYGYPSPWYAGSFKWIIPVQWRVVGSSNAVSLPNRTQTFSIQNTNGTSTVSKLGQSVTRTP